MDKLATEQARNFISAMEKFGKYVDFKRKYPNPNRAQKGVIGRAKMECYRVLYDLAFTPERNDYRRRGEGDMLEALEKLEQHLTSLALDGGDSAPLQAVSTPEVLSLSLSDSASRPAAQ